MLFCIVVILSSLVQSLLKLKVNPILVICLEQGVLPHIGACLDIGHTHRLSLSAIYYSSLAPDFLPGPQEMLTAK